MSAASVIFDALRRGDSLLLSILNLADTPLTAASDVATPHLTGVDFDMRQEPEW